jgi:hypothetical protein
MTAENDRERLLREVGGLQGASGRHAVARVSALRELGRLEAPHEPKDFPVDDDGRFMPMGPERWDIYRCESDEDRERWRQNWQLTPRRATCGAARSEADMRACPRCGWRLPPERFREGSDRCHGCEKDTQRASARPSYPEKAQCPQGKRFFFRFTAWQRWCGIQCARRGGV